VVRGIVDEALGATLLRGPLRNMPLLEPARATTITRDFTKALRHDRFAEVGERTLGEWVEHVVDLPRPGDAPTADDELLRDRIEAMTPAERVATEELVVDDTRALRDLSPLAALTGL